MTEMKNCLCRLLISLSMVYLCNKKYMKCPQHPLDKYSLVYIDGWAVNYGHVHVHIQYLKDWRLKC